MFIAQLLTIVGQLALTIARPTLDVRDGATAVVHLDQNTGNPQHLGSGILYGVPDAANQIPDNFYTQIGFNYLRAGGAQTLAPGRGWIWGRNEYKVRFASALSNYKTARKYGAKFILLPHDIWGADSTQNSTAPYPGDNGDWTFYDQYLTQLFSDIKANKMTDGLIFDIWNEPDLGTVFWGRSQDQYNQMWGRTFAKVRQAFGTSVLISGPSTSGEPGIGNGWGHAWNQNFASFVKANGTEPDQWAWHMETGGSSMNQAYAGFKDLINKYGLTGGKTPVNINEYAVFDEQVPSGAAWWISQLERFNANGLRGNWLSTGQLHDFLASLLSKPGAPSQYSQTGTGYYPNAEWQLYKYYATNMTGYRVATDASSDLALDVYSTVDKTKRKVKLIVGVRLQTGTWYVKLDKLSSLGLPSSGTLNIQTYGFVDQGHYGQYNGPDNRGVYGHAYSGDSVTFPIYQTDKTSAFAFEFDI